MRFCANTGSGRPRLRRAFLVAALVGMQAAEPLMSSEHEREIAGRGTARTGTGWRRRGG